MLYGPKAGGQKEKSVLSVEMFSSPGGKTRCTVIIHAGRELTGEDMGLSRIRAPELSELSDTINRRITTHYSMS